MKCDSRASLLARTLASLCVGYKPKVRVSLEFWHCCLRHVSKTMIKKMEILGVVDGLQIHTKIEEICHGCAHGNSHRKSLLENLVH
jgi:hypothetical protein